MNPSDQGIYRRVSVRLWADEKVRKLSPLQPSAQALWLYLLTGPHTGPIPGVFACGRAAMAEALDWEPEAFGSCLAELVEAGMVEYDHPSRLWFIPKAIRHNPPASPNVVRSWRAAWLLLPEGAMRDRMTAGLAEVMEGLSEAFMKAFGEAFAEGLPEGFAQGSAEPSPKASPRPSPNQEQEQEQEKKTRTARAALPPDPSKPKSKPKPAGMTVADLVAEGVPEQAAVDWLAARKAKKAGPVTPTAWAALQREAKAAGLTTVEAVTMAAERGWLSFRRAFLDGSTSPGRGPARRPSVLTADEPL